MKHDWFLSQDDFDALLDWLDPDREQAGMKYEDIRKRLIKIFTARGCAEAEDLADETINRVISRLSEIKDEFKGDRARYFFGVANKVYMEYMRRKPPQAPPPQDTDSQQVELEYRCLEQCIASLSQENRNLLLKYYGAEGRSKVDQRKRLAEELGLVPNALRIRAYRIRLGLQECVEKCVERSGDEISGGFKS
jgi:DNA-directed RNA polymerase specialized sigma24 family protein